MFSRAHAICWGALLLAGAMTLVACDSSGDDALDVDVVVGTYVFTRLTFTPTAPAIAAANVLDTLVAAQTSLRFTGDKRLLLNYQFQGSTNSLFISGTYDVNGQQVGLRLDGSFDASRKRLLLPREFGLRVLEGGARLEGDVRRNGVDLTEFSSRYAGVPPIDGTLQLQLRRN